MDLKATSSLSFSGMLAITLMSVSTNGAASAEGHPGKALHEAANCMSCHTSKPYDPQKTTSFPKLVQTVQFCNDNLNAGMFEDEIEQLADYLNETYYHHVK
ncbi:hypothetical protein [Thiomicrorhabdus sediminis]|uniref:Cytochrome c domain-containing protein n=1 Tax=Thiomicrorhabdus sediminis TaxID=2580412 RepID=A0A4P9K7F0_9GAMM|nr:hypothetical protein [Thiomicrorhabdus sediminis]QCU90177.1 hypothetical protein FE785_05810 [Thiomicrorhabdus sediminis]